MTSNKFESLLELLINEENDKAEALFHEIVVEKSRDIYEGLADEEVKEETKEDNKDEAVAETEESKDEAVKETEDSKDEEVKETEEAKDETVDETVEIEDEATESETTEEESIEEVGGDATDELVKDISADQEGEMDKPADDMGMDMDKDAEGDAEGDVEDRVVDLEDALDELKAEFEPMMGNKDGEEDKEEESLEMPAVETQPEMSIEGKKDMMAGKKSMMAGKKMDKKNMKEYKNPVTANHSDGSDKSAKSPVAAKGAVPTVGGAKVKTGASGSNIAQAQADSGNSSVATPQKMAGDFENTGGKAKSTSFKKAAPKPVTADASEKSAKSTIAGK